MARHRRYCETTVAFNGRFFAGGRQRKLEEGRAVSASPAPGPAHENARQAFEAPAAAREDPGLEEDQAEESEEDRFGRAES